MLTGGESGPIGAGDLPRMSVLNGSEVPGFIAANPTFSAPDGSPFHVSIPDRAPGGALSYVELYGSLTNVGMVLKELAEVIFSHDRSFPQSGLWHAALGDIPLLGFHQRGLHTAVDVLDLDHPPSLFVRLLDWARLRSAESLRPANYYNGP